MAPTDSPKNYKRKSVNGVLKHVHIMVWEEAYGPVPKGFLVDHRDGDIHNNRLDNLRLATRSQNVSNSKKPRSNTSGLKGLSWCRTHGYWVGTLWHHGRKFAKTGDALTVAAWLFSKRVELHGDFARFT